MTKVLGLDLSSRTGWALFRDKDSAPRLGTLRLPKPYNPEDYGARCWPLMEWVQGMVDGHAPDIVAYESPFIPMRPTKADDEAGKANFTTTQHALRLQISLAATIETAVARENARRKEAREPTRVRCLEVATSSAKLALAGSARLADKKRDMVRAAWARGWETADDHQADAIGVALVVYSSLETA